MNWPKLTLSILLTLQCTFKFIHCYMLDSMQYIDDHRVEYFVTFTRTGMGYKESFQLLENSIYEVLSLQLAEDQCKTFKIASLQKGYSFMVPNNHFWKLEEPERGVSHSKLAVCWRPEEYSPSFIAKDVITLTENPVVGNNVFRFPLPYDSSTVATLKINDFLSSHSNDPFVLGSTTSRSSDATIDRSFIAKYAYGDMIYDIYCVQTEWVYQLNILRRDTKKISIRLAEGPLKIQKGDAVSKQTIVTCGAIAVLSFCIIIYLVRSSKRRNSPEKKRHRAIKRMRKLEK